MGHSPLAERALVKDTLFYLKSAHQRARHAKRVSSLSKLHGIRITLHGIPSYCGLTRLFVTENRKN
jgi:hypothetical protein